MIGELQFILKRQPKRLLEKIFILFRYVEASDMETNTERLF